MRRSLLLGALGAVIALSPGEAPGWDGQDGDQTRQEVGADITDVYAWMSEDGSRINLVLDVTMDAPADAVFPTTVQYVFHTASRANPTAAEGPHPVDVLCTFDAAQIVSCWAGAHYVTGDATEPAGIADNDGALRVFTGVRNDPFFMNKLGWDVMAETVHRGNRAVYEWDGAGCPLFTPDRSQLTLNELKAADERGSGGFDFYQSFNVQSIVLSIDKKVLTQDGPIVSVWASTNRAP